jgi:hypothetical protein
LAKMEVPSLEKSIFKFQPKHNSFLEDETRAWAWYLVLGPTADQQFKDAIFTVAQFGVNFTNSMVVCPAKSQDGPLAKEVAKWITANGGGKEGKKGKGRGKGKKADADDGMEEGAAGKRPRKG